MLATLWLPQDISENGYQVDRLINGLHWFMLVLFVGWGAFFLYCMFKFRQRPGHTATHESIKTKTAKYCELAVIGIEAFLLVVLTMPVWASYKNDRPDPAKALEVRIYAQQYQWNVQYPGPDGKFGRRDPKFTDDATNPAGLDPDDPDGKDDVTTINRLHTVKNQPVIVNLTSRDVIHSFAVPMLRVKQDVIPGMMVPIWFTATKTSQEVREMATRTVTIPADESGDFRFMTRNRNKILTQDAKGDGGDVVLAKGAALTEEGLPKLRQAGVTEISVTPRDPIDIQCAQLCGLGHYRMRGTVVVTDQEAFDTWYATAGVEVDFEEDEDED